MKKLKQVLLTILCGLSFQCPAIAREFSLEGVLADELFALLEGSEFAIDNGGSIDTKVTNLTCTQVHYADDAEFACGGLNSEGQVKGFSFDISKALWTFVEKNIKPGILGYDGKFGIDHKLSVPSISCSLDKLNYSVSCQYEKNQVIIRQW